MQNNADDLGRAVDLDPELTIPVGDETVAASRYSPTKHDGPLPVVLVATPYRKDDWITFGSWEPSIQYFCRQGYEVVVADLLGTGVSTGDEPPFHRCEGPQLSTVIEWLADREWTTGNVGMFGLSYGAWTQYAAAAEAPEALKAIVPVAVSPSVYESSVPGGVFNPMKRATWPTLMQTLRALPPSKRDDDGRWLEIWEERLDALETTEPWLFRFLEHEAYDEFWTEREVAPEEITVPTLAACGYRDDHTAPMVEFFGGIDAPKRLLLGPWRHRMPEQGREVAADFRRQATEWFDHFLKGEDNGARDYPTVTYWTERDGGWKPGAGAWRGTEAWATTNTGDASGRRSTTGADSTPERRSATETDDVSAGPSAADASELLSYALSPDGLVPTDSFTDGRFDRTHVTDHTVGVESLDRVGRVTNVGVPTNADDARSLVVETEPLAEPVEWTGTGHAMLSVRPTKTPLVLSVRVTDVDTDGAARLVSAGSRRASHGRDGAGTPPEPGVVSSVRIPLKPKSHVFERGHRIRVAVSGAYFPRALPPRTSGPFDVVSTPEQPSEVVFPGRTHAGDVRFDDRVEVREPDRSVPTETPYKRALDARWGVDRDHTAGTATLHTSSSSSIDLPDGKLHADQRVAATVAGDDPSTAAVECDVAAELRYDTETVSVSTESRTSRAVSTLTTTVTVDGEPMFERTWRRLDPM